MSELTPGWYKDPAEPTTQRYWDGEGWIGDPLPVDAEPPPGPPPERRESELEPEVPPVPGNPGTIETPPVRGERKPERRTPREAAPQPTGAPYAAAGHPPQPHGHQLATPGARLLARLVDIALVLGLNVLVNSWFLVQLWNEFSPTVRAAWEQAMAGQSPNAETVPEVGAEAGNLVLVIVVIAAALWFAYEVPAVANSGQTVGKRLLGIKVVRLESAEPLSFGRSFRRWNTMGVPTVAWPCFGIGFALQLVDALFVPFDRPLHQALHDKSAHTAVVAVHPPQEASDEPADAS